MNRLQAIMAGDGNRPRAIRALVWGDTFLFGLACEFFDRMNQQGADIGVALACPGRMAGELRAQDLRATVLLQGMAPGGPVNRVRPIQCILDAANPAAAPQKIAAWALEPTLRYIVTDDQTGGLQCFDALAALMRTRFEQQLNGCVFLACERAADNGQRLRRGILDAAARLMPTGNADFLSWIADQNRFCTTQADRQSFQPTGAAQRKLFDILGYEDECLIVAEPFGEWVIEAPELGQELPLDRCTGTIFTPDIVPYRSRRALLWEAAQVILAPAAFMAGHETFAEAMADEALRDFLGNALLREVLPAVPFERSEAAEYVIQLCQRLENPFMPRPILPRLWNAPSRWVRCVWPTMIAYERENYEIPARLCRAFAALIMLYAGIRPSGSGYCAYQPPTPGAAESDESAEPRPRPIRDDDEEVLRAFSHLACDMDPDSLAYAVLADQELWHADLRALPSFDSSLASALRDLQLLGLYESLKE